LEQGLSDAFTTEVKQAWIEAYTVLASTMKAAAAKVQLEDLCHTISVHLMPQCTICGHAPRWQSRRHTELASCKCAANQYIEEDLKNWHGDC